MIFILRRLLKCTTATAVVETAIFTPIYLTLTLGIADVGMGAFTRMTANAAAQAGAAYAVINSGSGCASLTSACLTGIKTAMNDAAGNASFCTGTVCTASIATCADGSPKCIIVSANYPYSPILPYAVYSWAQSMTILSTATIRVQ